MGDASDMDGGVNMRGYNIYSIYQARRIEFLQQGDREYLITLDAGLLHINHEYTFTDYERARTLSAAQVFDTGDPVLEEQLRDDSQLGRLAVSTVDGVRPDGRIQNVFAFGGRGFSIHSKRTFNIRSATVDTIEQVTMQYMPDVFNSAYMGPSTNPNQDKEASSPLLGPFLQAMEIANFRGKTVLFLGAGNSGIIYIYILSPDAECPQPFFTASTVLVASTLPGKPSTTPETWETLASLI